MNQTGRPVGVGLPDKLYDFAHLVTSAGNLAEIFPPNTTSVGDDANIVPSASKNVERNPGASLCLAEEYRPGRLPHRSHFILAASSSGNRTVLPALPQGFAHVTRKSSARFENGMGMRTCLNNLRHAPSS
ncbi:MAG TPA: hypothetical protein VK577_12315, partial [Bradyrhizobium sp.]|nr:hypothetical protein [Bradyrhizobium sp.]